MLDPVSNSLEKYLDVTASRQKLVASNIANADTPGYRTLDLDFQSEFQAYAQGGSAMHPQEVTGIRIKNNGNSVNLDREARLLSENSIRFSAVTNLLRSRFQILKSAINEGQGS